MSKSKEQQWQEQYQALQTYKAKYRHTWVTGGGQHDELHTWVTEQRIAFKRFKMPIEHIIKLRSIGFLFNVIYPN